MAILSSASALHGLTGRINNLLFRNINGKTVVSAYTAPKKPKKLSELQQLNRSTFTDAVAYAKRITRDPVKYEQYKRKAKKLGVNNAYTAALTEYLRKGKIEHIDKTKMAKRGEIVVKGYKERAAFKKVEVRLMSGKKELARGLAVSIGGNDWRYRYKGERLDWENVSVEAEATDIMGNVSCWSGGISLHSTLD